MKRLTLLICSLLFSINVFAQELTITNEYVRATPPHAKNSAAFLSIENDTDKDIKLVSASSDIAERVELHTHTEVDGMMQMRQVEDILINAKSKTTLQPGSFHIMFLGLKSELTEGESVEFTLYFDNGDEVKLNAPIQKISMSKKISDNVKHQH